MAFGENIVFFPGTKRDSLCCCTTVGQHRLASLFRLVTGRGPLCCFKTWSILITVWMIACAKNLAETSFARGHSRTGAATAFCSVVQKYITSTVESEPVSTAMRDRHTGRFVRRNHAIRLALRKKRLPQSGLRLFNTEGDPSVADNVVRHTACLCAQSHGAHGLAAQAGGTHLDPVD